MFKKKSILLVILIFQILILTVSSVTAFDDSRPSTIAKQTERWTTYIDPRFDFSIDYPADWTVIPRNDNDPNALGTILTFIPAHTEPTTTPVNIVIGLHLSELESGQSLYEWNELYKNASRVFEEESLVRENPQTLKIAGHDAIYEKGISPITNYQIVQVARGKTVWFIWINSDDPATSNMFKKILRSLRFGDKAPASLREAYGNDFVPQQWNSVDDSQLLPQQLNDFLTVVDLPSAYLWWAPVIGSYNVTCGSQYHTGRAEYAADVGVYRKAVYTARQGTISFAGWNANGYGNLIRIQTSSSGTTYTHYYAHLESIFQSTGTANTFSLLGISGDTGNGPHHLHFHIQTNADAVDLTGMNGFSPDNDYPDGNNVVCGTMGR
ncbi:MAG: M23 family metallopeptidase [Chloroflexi bacterium]|nr:M23 family metallopeptidase [Chloroflexota bacterium]